jgi:DNA-binding transcriptional MerR regulator
MDDAALFTIGRLAKRTGLPVRTIRYWSDVGAVPPAGRTGSGHRLYDAACVARLELVATLRELGVGLADVRRVLENKTTVAEVAAVHVKALDTQIAALRLRRAVLATAAKRRLGTKEMTLMNKLAKLSAQERKQIIDDFVTEVFHGLEPDPGIAERLRQATPELPDNPSSEQIGAWVELAGLVQDPAFRRRIRAMAEYGAREQARGGGPDRGGQDPDRGQDATDRAGQDARTADFAGGVVEHAGAARDRGVTPESAEGAEVLDRILVSPRGDQRRADLLAQLEAGTDARAERYWQLLGIINGWPPFPAHVPAFEWMIAALRAHG